MPHYVPEPVVTIGVVSQTAMHETRMDVVQETEYRLTVHTPGSEMRPFDMTKEQLRVLQNQINTVLREQKETCGPECGHQRDLVEVCGLCKVVVEDDLVRLPMGKSVAEQLAPAELEVTIGTVMPGPDFHEENGDS